MVDEQVLVVFDKYIWVAGGRITEPLERPYKLIKRELDITFDQIRMMIETVSYDFHSFYLLEIIERLYVSR